MVRNIPNKYTLEMMTTEINSLCEFKYDFFYLPIDPRSKCNMGYAFINFTSPIYALEFFAEFNQRKWDNFKSIKITQVIFGKMQGLDKLKNHFDGKKVMS